MNNTEHSSHTVQLIRSHISVKNKVESPLGWPNQPLSGAELNIHFLTLSIVVMALYIFALAI